MAEKKSCVSCGKGFIAARKDRQTCSPACRLRVHRAKAKPETVEAAVPVAKRGRSTSGARARSAEAVALLAALDAEAIENAEARGDEPGQPPDWSAAERVVLALIAQAVDRKVDLWARFWACPNDELKVRIKLSTELRQLEVTIARLLKQVNTDVAAPQSFKSLQASRAALVKHHGPGSA